MWDVDPLTRPGPKHSHEGSGDGDMSSLLRAARAQGNGETAADGGQLWEGQEGLEQNGI